MSWVVRMGWDKPERNVDVKESSARRRELDCLLSSAVTVRTGRREKNREGLFEGEHSKVLGACGEKQE